jgi:Cysteine-rich secretory protein family
MFMVKNTINKTSSITIVITLLTTAAAILTVQSPSMLQPSYAQLDATQRQAILDIHNRERAAVGVAPLTWSDSLAAGAQAWAEQIARTGLWMNDPVNAVPQGPNGENIARFDLPEGPTDPRGGTSLWVNEKENWQGGVLTQENSYRTGHYTQMVWSSTTQVGCGTAALHWPNAPSGWLGILVCRYLPPGNYIGQAPY